MLSNKLPLAFKHTATPLRKAGYISNKEYQKAANKIARISKVGTRIEEIMQTSNLLLRHKINFDGGFIPVGKILLLDKVEESLAAFEQIKQGNIEDISQITLVTGDIARYCATYPFEVPEFHELHFDSTELISLYAARELSKFPGCLSFDSIHYLQEGIITAIAPQTGQLDFPNLRRVSDKGCKALASYPRYGIDISWATETSTTGFQTIVEGAIHHQWDIILLGITQMTDPLAATCRDFPGDLYLPRLNFDTLTHNQKLTLEKSTSPLRIGRDNSDIKHLMQQQRQTYN